MLTVAGMRVEEIWSELTLGLSWLEAELSADSRGMVAKKMETNSGTRRVYTHMVDVKFLGISWDRGWCSRHWGMRPSMLRWKNRASTSLVMEKIQEEHEEKGVLISLWGWGWRSRFYCGKDVIEAHKRKMERIEKEMVRWERASILPHEQQFNLLQRHSSYLCIGGRKRGRMTCIHWRDGCCEKEGWG